MPHAAFDDIEMFYETAGPDGGEPVLLIMGLGGRGIGWELQINGLSGHHPVAWFDNRGVGETRARPRAYTTRLMADDARQLMDHLGWGSAHIVGASMGGMIAQEFALNFPRRTRSLTLIATHPGGMRARLPTARGFTRFVRASLGPASKRGPAAERLLFTDEYLATCNRQEVRARLARSFEPMAPRHKAGQLAAVLRHQTARRLRALAAPTLIVKPSRDVLIRPGQSDRLHRLIPGSRLEVFDAGHGVIRQHADRINALLLEHFAAVPR